MGPDLMLATTTTLPPNVAAATMTANGLWVAEVKLDGIRAAVTMKGRREVRITNRRQVDITVRYPDVVEALRQLNLNAVLDGEIVVWGTDGNPDFAKAHRRDAQATEHGARALAAQRGMGATFVAFDILELNGTDLRRLPYSTRRRRLEDLAKGTPLRVNAVCDDGGGLWEEIVTRGLEGVVLKRKDSRYVGHRSPDWVKVKLKRRVSALVCGTQPGKGSLAGTWGALDLALLEPDGRLRPIGSVGTGFANADRQFISALIQRASRGGDQIIVEIEFMEVSPSGHLRQPSYRGLRTDLVVTDCTVDQLEGRRT